ncbi:MAG: hypothetical protein D3910_21340 [Candidatus Electrothrix sp. ATG2]|nr:hypothetical protein [Candidatus Electrothrix sp. ATG2]
MTTLHPSILPYFQTGPGKIVLRLNPSSSQKSPFSLIDDKGDTLARLIHGAFVTDSGAVIKEVNLLVQRDCIDCSDVALPGLCNSEVEHYWRQSLKIRRARAPEHTMLLGMQLDTKEELLPFSPLFYCTNRAFF